MVCGMLPKQLKRFQVILAKNGENWGCRPLVGPGSGHVGFRAPKPVSYWVSDWFVGPGSPSRSMGAKISLFWANLVSTCDVLVDFGPKNRMGCTGAPWGLRQSSYMDFDPEPPHLMGFLVLHWPMGLILGHGRRFSFQKAI